MPGSLRPRPAGLATALLMAVPALLGIAAWLILGGHRVLAGVAALGATGGSMVIVASGAAAGNARPAFAARVLDRAFEAAILAPIAWVTRETSLRVAILAMVGLGASYLASYERAKGTSLGYRQREGNGYRAARWAILVVGLLIRPLLEASLWAFVAITLAASAIRAANVVHQERRAGLTATGRGSGGG